MTRLQPSNWQRAAIAGLAERLTRTRGSRAALLQLPTGFGKSLVAARLFEELRKRKPGLRFVVVLPKQAIPSGWLAALGVSDSDVPMFQWIRSNAVNGLVRFETRLRLRRAMFDPSRGRPPTLANEIHAGPCLIVVDEVHRHRRFLETLSWLFLQRRERMDGSPERYLTAPFRSPLAGARRWPKWLLLSATPFNPVSLDTVDPLDEFASDQTFEGQQPKDEDALADEVEKTLGALGQLAGVRRGPWFDEHISKARARLANGASGRALRPPAELIVWPASVQQRAFRPPSDRRWSMPRPRIDAPHVEAALREVVITARALGQLPANGASGRASAERFVLSGGLLSVEGHRIQGETYGPSLARSVKAAVSVHRKLGTVRPAKLENLVAFLRRISPNQHVLVFCVHRAVAAGVAQAARVALAERARGEVVRTAIAGIEERDRRWFIRPLSGKTRVLVATDACSESIDLHLSANVLVHYELPWSPLRVLQRVGRLWRIRPKEITPGTRPRTPNLPGVVHFAHPGSVDEEILSRLRRRWGHLSALGLDYLSYEDALGVRLPVVDWPPGG